MRICSRIRAQHFAGIVDHLRLDVTPEQIDEAVALASFDRLRAAEEKAGFAERPEHAERFFREGRAGQWRERAHPRTGRAHRRRSRRADGPLRLSAGQLNAAAAKHRRHRAR